MSISDIPSSEIDEIRQTCRSLVSKCEIAIRMGAPNPHILEEIKSYLDIAAEGPTPEKTIVQLRKSYEMFFDQYDKRTRATDLKGILNLFESVEDYIVK